MKPQVIVAGHYPRRPLLTRFWRLAALALTFAAAAPGPAQAVDVTKVGGLLRWMDDHPGNSGLVALPATGGPAIAFHADRGFPLASVRKVLTAGALVDGHGLGGEVARRKVDRFYVPGTDLGNHERAHLTQPRLKIADVADGMIRHSSNAAADYLLQEVGRKRVDAWARSHGMSAQDPVYSFFGEFASWANDPGWLDTTTAQRPGRAERRAAFTGRFDIRLPSLSRQRKLTRRSVSGTPAEWAPLMRFIGTAGAPALRNLLNWPLRKFPRNREIFDAYLTKGGSLPGTVTEVSWIDPKGPTPGTAVALFLRDVPDRVQAKLFDSFSHQLLMQRIAFSPAFAVRVAKTL